MIIYLVLHPTRGGIYYVKNRVHTKVTNFFMEHSVLEKEEENWHQTHIQQFWSSFMVNETNFNEHHFNDASWSEKKSCEYEYMFGSMPT